MAIYHLNANVISRARGQSIVAAAAYRAGARLRDDRYGVIHNYAGRRVCAHAEIMAPDGTPDWVHDRELLWNRVEAAEQRKDSQLARVIELGLPIELSHDESLALVREYITLVFVARGMIADFYIRRDNPGNPHAHILLTLRGVTQQGFGPKERRWNGRANLLEWRAAWAQCANQHLAAAGHAVRIDHRTLEAQQIELTPARRTGIGRPPAAAILPEHLAERIAEQQRIARSNGEAILQDPTLALRALTQQSPSFSELDLERFLRSRTADALQFAAAMAAVRRSPDRVEVAGVAGAVPRFTSADMIDAAKSLHRRVISMASRRGHALTPHDRETVFARVPLHDAASRAFEILAGEGAIKALALRGDPASLLLLDAVVAAWSAAGLHVVRIMPRALEAAEALCHPGGAPLRATSVLVLEAAEMLGLKQLERVVAAADRARAAVVLIGDSARLAAMDGDTPFASVLQAMRFNAR